MKTVLNPSDDGSLFLARLSEAALTMCACMRIERTDGTVLGFTDHDKAMTIDIDPPSDSLAYNPAVIDSPGAIAETADLAVDNFSFDAFLDISGGIARADLLAGLYDGAEIKIFIIDWTYQSYGIMPLKRGWLGPVVIQNGKFQAEFRSLAQKLQQPIGRAYLPLCDADLGDSRCAKVLTDFTKTGAVGTVTSRAVFAATITSGGAAENYYRYGKLTWTSGANNGVSREVQENTYAAPNYGLTLCLAMERAVVAGDTFSIIAGCDKSAAICASRFDNFLNFRGFPYIPGRDVINQWGNKV